MGFGEDLGKVKSFHIFSSILGFLAVIGPGFLTIFHYHPDLVLSYDIFKLLVFSTALTAPFFLALTFIWGQILSVSGADEKLSLLQSLTGGAISSSGMLYLVLAASYFLELSFPKMMLMEILLTSVISTSIPICALIERLKGKKQSN